MKLILKQADVYQVSKNVSVSQIGALYQDSKTWNGILYYYILVTSIETSMSILTHTMQSEQDKLGSMYS